MSSLQDQADKAIDKGKGKSMVITIKTWKEEGETFYGVLLQTKPFDNSRFENSCMMYIFDTDDGLVSTVFGAATDKALEKEKLVGHLLKIIFHGKISLEDGRQCNKFEIIDTEIKM